MAFLLPALLGRKQDAEATPLGKGDWPHCPGHTGPLTVLPSRLPLDSSPSSSSTPASGCSSPNDSEHGPNPVLGSEVSPCQAGLLGAVLRLSLLLSK